VLHGRGHDANLAEIEFTDPRYAGRFKEFPMLHPFRELRFAASFSSRSAIIK
jgi:hypothetical protein